MNSNQIRKLIAKSIITTFILCLNGQIYAEIIVGPWTFNDLAFADAAFQLEDGHIDYRFGGSSLDEVLTGYTPNLGICNIGFDL
jgi:hypothetical protein